MHNPALRAKQLLQPFIAEHQHWVSMEHQLGSLFRHAPLLEFFHAQQVQKVFAAVALDPLVRVGWAKKLPPLRSLPAAGAFGRLLIGVNSLVELVACHWLGHCPEGWI